MLILIHVLIACAGLVTAGLAYFRPARTWLYVTYAALAFTLTSGIFLVLTRPSHITQVCLTGLAYTAVVLAAVIGANRKLHTGENA